jgi:diguanylate cyclase (GGDEF)-like protein
MEEKELEELEHYASLMQDFVSKQEAAIRGIEQRFNTIYEHHKMVARLAHSTRKILTKFDLKEKEDMALNAIELKKFVMQTFDSLIREEIQLMRQDSGIISEENKCIAAQQNIFTNNYLRLRDVLGEKSIRGTDAAEKLKKEAEHIKRIMEKQKKRHNINDYINDIIRDSESLIKDIKDLVLDELGVLDSFIFREKYIPDKQGLKASLLKLSQISNRLTKLLKKEKREIIDPIKMLLENKKDISSEVAASFVQGKGIITIETIKNDLRRMTTKPEEVRAYVFKIMQYRDYFEPAMAGQIEKYLGGVHRWSEAATERQEATEDELTKVGSRKKLNQDLDKDISRARRIEGAFSIAMIDVDNFKEFNDTYGHQIGDDVLVFLAHIMKSVARVGQDEPYRYGGEEFCMIYTDTEKDRAKKAAERLREAVEDTSKQKMRDINSNSLLTIKGGKTKKDKITVSIGLATYPEDGLDSETLTKKADDALYYSKDRGRNRVTVAGEHEVLERKRR